MRDFKFRAWNKKNKCWVDRVGATIAFPYAISPDKLFDPKLALFGFSNKEYNDIEWMQYTELKDKNGREIYELDILKEVKNNLTSFYLVKFGKYNNGEKYEDNISGNGWYTECIQVWNGKDTYFGIISGADDFSDAEVIGNLWEVPDLFKESQ